MTEPHRLAQVQQLAESSRAVLFKHSTRCPISDTVLDEVREVVSAHSSVEFYIVNVIEERALSQQIEEWSGVRHQSPQVILFRGGKPVWHASHYDATSRALEDAIQTII